MKKETVSPKTSKSAKKKVLSIDASNIRQGGGVTHLEEISKCFDSEYLEFDEVHVWAPSKTIDRAKKSPRVIFHTHPFIEAAGLKGYLFRKFVLDKEIRKVNSDLLWVPGGSYLGKFSPYVTMVRNFLPFDQPERDRFKFSKTWLRYLYLRHSQLRSFSRADGLIHISNETNRVINQLCDLTGVSQKVIHHGISEKFRKKPRDQRDFADKASYRDSPIRILYVSPINLYKHQDVLIEALAGLRDQDYSIELNLVGTLFPMAKKSFEQAIQKYDPSGEWVRYHGIVPYHKIETFHQEADIYVCLSSCETFGMVLLEGMASGLPVVCSDRSTLPEIAGDSCKMVDPENVEEVRSAIVDLVKSLELRTQLANAAYERSLDFSWEKCGVETFKFLSRWSRLN